MKRLKGGNLALKIIHIYHLTHFLPEDEYALVCLRVAQTLKVSGNHALHGSEEKVKLGIRVLPQSAGIFEKNTEYAY